MAIHRYALFVYRTGIDAAIEQAEQSWREGGIPIGAALLDAQCSVVSVGHNERVQSGDPTAHAEMVCLRNAGRRRDWKSLRIVTTLSPCPMCTGAIVLYGIPIVVIGENRTFLGAEGWLEERGVSVVHLDDARCVALMRRLQRENPDLWAEDIGQ